MKICSKCLEEKDIFSFRKSGKYYRGECKSCEKDLYKKNKDKVSEYNKRYYKSNKWSKKMERK